MNKSLRASSEERYEWLYKICAETQDIVFRVAESVFTVLNREDTERMRLLADSQQARLKRYLLNDQYILKRIDHVTYSHAAALTHRIGNYLESHLWTYGLSDIMYTIPPWSEQMTITEDNIINYKKFLLNHLYTHLWRDPDGRYIQNYSSTYTYPEYVALLFGNDFDNLFWEWFHHAPAYTWRGIRACILHYGEIILLPAVEKELALISERRRVDQRWFEHMKKRVHELWLGHMN